MDINKQQCMACNKAVFSKFTNSYFCDNDKSPMFLDDVAIYEKKNAGGNLRGLTVLDCGFFENLAVMK